MRKLFITLMLNLSVFVYCIYSTPKEILAKLPVRVLSGNTVVNNLTKDDFILQINGKEKGIINVVKNNRSLQKANSPRNFVLAFNITDYESKISMGISYFIENILKKEDKLIILSPINIYQIHTNRSNKHIIEMIKKIVKKDTIKYKNNVIHHSKTLEGIIKQYYVDVKAAKNLGSSSSSQRTISQFFLSSYSRELKNFKSKFIVPNLIKIQKAAELLAQHSGERWIINFQDREIIPGIVPYRKVAEEIFDLATLHMGIDKANATRMYTVLNQIEKILLISEGLPLQKIINALLEANICYHAILFKEPKKAIKMGIGNSVAHDLDETFSQIAKPTGGLAIINANFKDALNSIQKVYDVYYVLTFKTKTGLNDIKITIKLKKPEIKVYYKKLFTNKEIESLSN